VTVLDVQRQRSARAGEMVLEVDGLSVEFATDRGWTQVVDEVSFDLRRGETLAIVGESGSGKSVTSLACMGLLPRGASRVTKGRVVLNGTDVLKLPKRAVEDLRGDTIAMVFQEPMSSLNPAYKIGNQIAEVVRRHRGASKKEGWARAVEVLDLVGIPRAATRAQSYPHEFSGGMRQRVMIAMAIACDPDVLIADEPTTALDVTIQAQVLDLLRKMRDELGMGVLFITHDLAVVADIADHVMVMYAGQRVETATVQDLFAKPQHPYTEGLLRAMPQASARRHKLDSIPGNPPVPWSLPAGCRFTPRCPYAIDECRAAVPELLESRPGHQARCIRSTELNLRGTTR
jgi:oligopeptide/dipeptide ABC transporter ATP-binding protein